MIALSYSRLSTYEQCPHKFSRQYITKDYPDDKDNPYFIKGQKKHKQLQNYIDCKNDATQIQQRYDGDVTSALTIVDGLVKAGFNLKAECQLSVDKNWEPVSWFSKQSMYRAIVDVLGTNGEIAINGDWKTGKYRDYDGSQTGQLHLSSLIVMCHMPTIQQVKSVYWFIESKQAVPRQFSAEMKENMKVPFMMAIETVNTDKEFKACKNAFCNWCLIKTQENKCPLDKK